MGTKSLTITDEAYERLASFKGEYESFSEVINKLTKRTSILSLVGILSSEEADELTKNVKKTTLRLRRNLRKTY